MTRTFYVQRKAEDLKLGDLYVAWAKRNTKDWDYEEPTRILNLKESKGMIWFHTAVGDNFLLHPEQQVVVMEVA